MDAFAFGKQLAKSAVALDSDRLERLRKMLRFLTASGGHRIGSGTIGAIGTGMISGGLGGKSPSSQQTPSEPV